MKQALSLVALVAALPAFAQDTRELGAHEHGVGTLNIAIEGNTIAMAFEAPGADLVGFEYQAQSDSDLVAIDGALASLGVPLDLFVLPDAASCSVVEAKAELETEDDDHADHDDHDDHEGHDDHEDHDDHEGHDDHATESGHTEFHAEYALTCANPDAVTQIGFAYFDMFPNALEVEVQIITATGAQAFEVERDAPILDLGR